MEVTFAPEEQRILGLLNTLECWGKQATGPNFAQLVEAIRVAGLLKVWLAEKSARADRYAYFAGLSPVCITREHGAWYVTDSGDYEHELRVLPFAFPTEGDALAAALEAGLRIHAEANA